MSEETEKETIAEDSSTASEESAAVENAEAVAEVVTAEEPVAAPVAETEAVQAPAPAPKAQKNAPKVAVSGAAKDDVLLSACVFKNVYARKSLTIHHVQRRLAELGYRDAGSDKDGWYGDLTKRAVAAFQKDAKLGESGIIDAATLEAIFDGDPYVSVILN
jgi:peptidoglycan hydrolase-like protein with peptidoglycan-binding domain